MTRTLLRWFASMLLLGTCGVAEVQAQRLDAKGYRGEGLTADTAEGRTPALPYAVALAYTLIVLVIACTPSRKHQVERD